MARVLVGLTVLLLSLCCSPSTASIPNLIPELPKACIDPFQECTPGGLLCCQDFPTPFSCQPSTCDSPSSSCNRCIPVPGESPPSPCESKCKENRFQCKGGGNGGCDGICRQQCNDLYQQCIASCQLAKSNEADTVKMYKYVQERQILQSCVTLLVFAYHTTVKLDRHHHSSFFISPKSNSCFNISRTPSFTERYLMRNTLLDSYCPPSIAALHIAYVVIADTERTIKSEARDHVSSSAQSTL